LCACKSRREWLTAVRPYGGKGLSAIVVTRNMGKKRKHDILQVFKIFCTGNVDAPPPAATADPQ
jgi:hypothetical protein